MEWAQVEAEEAVGGRSRASRYFLIKHIILYGGMLIISFASGKGGTGKTFVVTNVAASIDTGCQFLDCDVEAPNAGIFLKPKIARVKNINVMLPKVLEHKCTACAECVRACQYKAIVLVREKVLIFPEQCHSCGACIIACPEDAMVEKSRSIGYIELGACDHGIDFGHGFLNIGEMRSTPVISELKSFIDASRKFVIIDSPPGTACPVVNTVEESDYCVLVTEPTPFGLSDLKQAIGVLRVLKVPFGVIINRDGIGDGRVEEFCTQEGISVISKIPYDREVAEVYSRGELLFEFSREWEQYFSSLTKKILEIVQDEADSNN